MHKAQKSMRRSNPIKKNTIIQFMNALFFFSHPQLPLQYMYLLKLHAHNTFEKDSPI